jgi:ParB family chromosome partitioning protein
VKRPEINIGLTSYDDIFKSNEERNSEEIKPIPLSELKPFEEQPFKVLLDESMDELVESIQQSGVLSPIIARPHKDGGYEILSGHRRAKACEIAGITEVPVVIKNLDDDTAAILLVDSNLQRENILPSEKAFAYQLKLEAMRRKAGRPTKENYVQIEHNLSGSTSREELSKEIGESPAQIQRYIRLTNLIDPILDMVDNKQIAMNAAVEISYLGSKEQTDVLKAIEAEEVAPSIEQAKKLRRFSEDGRLNGDVVLSIMQEQKPEKVSITLKENRLRKYFPQTFTVKQMEDTIEKLLANWARKRSEPER